MNVEWQVLKKALQDAEAAGVGIELLETLGSFRFSAEF